MSPSQNGTMNKVAHCEHHFHPLQISVECTKHALPMKQSYIGIGLPNELLALELEVYHECKNL